MAPALRAIESRSTLKKKLLDTKSDRLLQRDKLQYEEADRTVKRMTRADKQAHMDELASQAGNAANKEEHGKVYKITRMVSGKYGGMSEVLINDTHL